MRTTPVDGVRSTLRNFRLGGLAERTKATPVLRTYYGDTKYQLGNLNLFLLKASFDLWVLSLPTSMSVCLSQIVRHCVSINLCKTSWPIILFFIKNVVAVAAYSRLASRSQAEFSHKEFESPRMSFRSRTCTEHHIRPSFTSIFASLVSGRESYHSLNQWPSQALSKTKKEE